ncbi:MAG: hypothetical protein R6X29_10425 [Acidimicrobiia bacterium]
MPSTGLGRWAGRLLVTSVVLLALLIAAFNTNVLGAGFAQRTAGGLALWVATAAAVVGTLVTGIVSWIRLADHSIVVIVATVFGVLGTILLGIGAIPQS